MGARLPTMFDVMVMCDEMYEDLVTMLELMNNVAKFCSVFFLMNLALGLFFSPNM